MARLRLVRLHGDVTRSGCPSDAHSELGQRIGVQHKIPNGRFGSNWLLPALGQAGIGQGRALRLGIAGSRCTCRRVQKSNLAASKGPPPPRIEVPLKIEGCRDW